MFNRMADILQGADGIRMTIALSMTAATIYGFIADKIESQVFVPIATLAIGFFFNKDKTPSTNGAIP